MANEQGKSTHEHQGTRTQQESQTPRQEQQEGPQRERRASGQEQGSGQQHEGRESREQGSVARRESLPRSIAAGTTNPFSLMRRLMDDLDQLFFVGGERSDLPWAPAVEILERDGNLVVRADVPGLEKDDINVELEDGLLVISGERRYEHEERKSGIYRSERAYGRFYRTIPLPDGVDRERANATFKDGVLEIALPMAERPQPRRLEVQQGSQAGAA